MQSLCRDVDANDIVDVDQNETEIHQYRAPRPHVEEFMIFMLSSLMYIPALCLK